MSRNAGGGPAGCEQALRRSLKIGGMGCHRPFCLLRAAMAANTRSEGTGLALPEPSRRSNDRRRTWCTARGGAARPLPQSQKVTMVQALLGVPIFLALTRRGRGSDEGR